MMRNERRQLLDRCLIDLSRDMDVDDVLLYLQGKGVFTDAVVDKVLVSSSGVLFVAGLMMSNFDDEESWRSPHIHGALKNFENR